MSRHRVTIRGFVALLFVWVLAPLAFAQVNVGVAEHEEHGAYLVDGEGASLYVYLPDAEVEGSACTGSCAQVWPPLTTDGEPEAGEGVDAELVGTVEREDGAAQVTYDGWPLYAYLQDREAGAVKGQGSGGNWFLVAPDGTVIGADLEDDESTGEAGEAAAAAGEELDFETLMARGQELYNNTCAGCHGVNGDEANGSHVARITESERTVSEGARLVRQIMYGGAYMPGFGEQLSNDDFLAIATYVRNSFGYDFGPVTREEVVAERERFN